MGNRSSDTIKVLENALNEENHKCERKHMYIVLEKGEYESHSLPEHAERLLCVRWASWGVHCETWATLVVQQMPGNRKEVKIAEEEKLDMKNFLNLKNNAIWTRTAVDPSGEEADSGFKFWL